MAHIKTITVKAIIYHAYTGRGYWEYRVFKTFTDDNGNKFYFIDEKEVSKEDGNKAYIEMKQANAKYQSCKDCKEYIKRQWASYFKLKKTGRWNESDFTLHEADTFLQKVEECDTTYEEIIEKLRNSIDGYTQYIDDYRQMQQAEANNARIREKIKFYERLIAERNTKEA